MGLFHSAFLWLLFTICTATEGVFICFRKCIRPKRVPKMAQAAFFRRYIKGGSNLGSESGGKNEGKEEAMHVWFFFFKV